MVGKTLSHYRILEEISRGGMGVVYRALDVKLNREVAIKMLTPELVSDPDRKSRFLQEARAAAALKHPNVGVVYEVDEVDEVSFIAMELIEGDTLNDVLQRGPLPLPRALEITTQIARALAHAHANGIVHRDLKPGNIMMAAEGHVKVIDFGLAKLLRGSEEALSDLVTAARPATEPGVVVGTVSYMSPEQATGRAVDARTDLFSLGVVLYQMLTGELPFKGASSHEILNAVVHGTPVPLESTMTGRGASLCERIVDRCLAKDPAERYQSANAVVEDLERVLSGRAEGSPSVKAIFLAGLVVAAVAALVVTSMWDRTPSVPRLVNPVQLTTASGVEDFPSWSPDGQTIAYTTLESGDLVWGSWNIWLTPTTGSGGAVKRSTNRAHDERFPTWSPRGREIAFWSDRDGGGYFLMSSLGGPARLLRRAPDAPTSPPQWSSDGERLAYVVLEDGNFFVEIRHVETEDIRRLPLPGSSERRFGLSWSPDGRFFAYVNAQQLPWQVSQLWLLRVADEHAFPLSERGVSAWSPSWSPDSRTVFFVSNRGGSMDLWQQPLQSDGTADGPERAITTGIGMRRAQISPDGRRIAYSQGRAIANLWRIPVGADAPSAWRDAEQLTFEQALVEFVDVSPGGEWIALSSDRSGSSDLWLFPSGGGEIRPLAHGAANDWGPAFSPDGSTVAFHSSRGGSRDLWVVPALGGSPRRLTFTERDEFTPDWSPDGRRLLFHSNRDGSQDLWMFSFDTESSEKLAPHGADDEHPRWTGGGDGIVFASTRDGESRLWRLDVANPPPVRLSEEPVHYFRLSRDGAHAFFPGLRGEKGKDIWMLSLETGALRAVTDLGSRPGSPGTHGLAADDRFLYFTWVEDLGDLWQAELVTE